MNNITDNNSPVTQGSSQEISIPTPNKIDLKSIDDVRLEMAKVYRSMKGKEIQASDGTRFVYVLAQIGKMIEIHDIEQRLTVLENKRVK